MVQVGIAFIAYHEWFCDKGQLISEEVDRKRLLYPVLTDTVIIVTALHLLRRIPPMVDPFHWVDLIHQSLKGTTT